MPPDYVAKVRYTHPSVIGTIEHVIQTGTFEQCMRVVQEHNNRYQTDEAIVERWDPEKFHWVTYTQP